MVTLKWIIAGIIFILISCSTVKEDFVVSPFRQSLVLYKNVPLDFVLTTHNHSKIELLSSDPTSLTIKKKSDFIFELKALSYGQKYVILKRKRFFGLIENVDSIKFKTWEYPVPVIEIGFNAKREFYPKSFFTSESANRIRLYYLQEWLPLENYIHQVHKYTVTIKSRSKETLFSKQFYGNDLNGQFGSVIDTLNNMGSIEFSELDVMDPFGKVIRYKEEFSFLIE